MKTFFQFFVKRHLFANALTVMILLMGLYSAFTLNREEMPNASLGIVLVNTLYPGAAPGDVELNVTNPIEDALKQVVGIKSMISSSLENSSSITIEIDDDVDQDEVYDEIQDAVFGVSNLPDEAEDPEVLKMEPAMKSILEVGLGSTVWSYAELRDYAHQFEKRLLDVPGVAQVNSTGYRDREIHIEVSPDKLVKYGITMNAIMQAIDNRNIRASGGSLESYTSQKNVVTLSKFRDPLEVGEVIIKAYSSGAVVTVNDVATVYDDFEEESVIPRINGKPTISFNVIKNESADIIRTVDAIKVMIEEEKALLAPDTVEFLFTADESIQVRNKMDIVVSNGAIGLVLVVIVLALFLNVRTSFWVAMGIPVSLLGVLILLPFFNIELDSLTMAAMVLVLGIIVDDAIVIAENIFHRREKGESPLDAAVNGLSEVALPVFTTVATTMLAFAPMLIITGKMGKFIFVIPVTVMLALCMSMLESYFILPAHLMSGLQGAGDKKIGRTWFHPLRTGFARLMHRLLNVRYVVVFVACALFVGAVLFAGSSMQFTLMPHNENVESIAINLEMPVGTSLEASSDTVRQVETIIDNLPDREVESYFVKIGEGGGMWSSKTPHLATVTLDMMPQSEFQRPVEQILADLRLQLSEIQEIETFSLGLSTSGPSIGKPVEVLIKGTDDDIRTQFADDVVAFLSQHEGVSDIERDDRSGKEEITIQVNYPLLARYGLTVADISQTVRIAYDGQVATNTRYGDEDIDFRVILQREYRKDIEYLRQLKIPNMQGDLVNLEEVATFAIGPGTYAFYHDDGDRTITVTGEINEDVVTSLEVMNLLQDHFRDAIQNYPGVRMNIGGEAQESQTAMRDLLFSFLLAAIGIYFLLMLLFESMTQPFIVLITVPFGLAGVILALALHGILQPSLFTAIGVIGLAGVVVNDALVMVDHLNAMKREKHGRKLAEMIAEGAANRLRPVILTTATTVAGLLPLVYGLGGTDWMMGPMALALGYGLLFATPVTLILLPCLYMILNDIHRLPAMIGRKKDR